MQSHNDAANKPFITTDPLPFPELIDRAAARWSGKDADFSSACGCRQRPYVFVTLQSGSSSHCTFLQNSQILMLEEFSSFVENQYSQNVPRAPDRL